MACLIQNITIPLLLLINSWSIFHTTLINFWVYLHKNAQIKTLDSQECVNASKMRNSNSTAKFLFCFINLTTENEIEFEKQNNMFNTENTVFNILKMFNHDVFIYSFQMHHI